MKLQTKALYNLLRLNLIEDDSIQCEPWQIEDLREVSTDELLQKFSALGVFLDKEQFIIYSDNCDTPEDLAEFLFADYKDPKIHDQLYLLVFELWRRLLPEKQSLSIFCDELDHLIFAYDRGKLESDEPLQDGLANLEEILDENADIGAEPTDVFQSLCEYCAHDIESFLYDFISEQIDAHNELYASELLEGFYPYMTDLRWFDFLRTRLLSYQDIAEANHVISHLMNELGQHPDLDLQIEVLRFMVNTGDRGLFVQLVHQTLPLLKTEEDFLELLEIVADYYRRLDQEEVEESIQKIMERRGHREPLQELDFSDPDLIAFNNLMKRT